MDGSSTQHARGIGVVLQSPEGDFLEYVVRLQFLTINNKAEYESLIKGLNLAKALGAESLVIQGDSQLIIGEMNGTCEAKEEQVKRYLSKVNHCIKGFTTAKFH